MQKTLIKKALFLLVMICLTAMSLSAQTHFSFTVEDARDYAIKHNRDIQKASLDVEIADTEINEIIGTGLPQLNITAGYNYMLDIPTQLIPGEIFGGEPGSTIPVKFGKPHLANYGVSVNQLIFNGSFFVGLKASRIYMELMSQNKTRTENEVKALVTNTYYLVLVGEETRKVIVQTLDNLKKTQEEIISLNEEGFNEKSDVEQIQISVNALQNALHSIGQQVEISYKLLKYQMGIPLSEEIVLLEKLPEILKAIDIKTPLETEFNVDSNTTYKLVKTRKTLADLSVTNEKSTFLPTIGAFLNFKRDAQRDQFDIFDPDLTWYPTSVIGLQMSWPVFSGSSKIFRVQKAKIQLNQADIEQEKTGEGLKLQHQQAKSALVAARDRYTNSQDNRDLALSIYETNLQKYREGLISSLDLTQAQNQYLTAERDYLQNVADALTAYTELKKVLEQL